MKLLVVFIICFIPSYSFAVDCFGDITLPNSDTSSIVSISFDEIKIGSIIELGAPITSDIALSMPFKIISVQYLPSIPIYLVREVIAVSTNTGSGDVMIFNHVVDSTNDLVLISDFKGFEDEIAYGPSELACK